MNEPTSETNQPKRTPDSLTLRKGGGRFTSETARKAQKRSVQARNWWATLKDTAAGLLDEVDERTGTTEREKVVRKCIEKAKAGDVKAMELLAKWTKEG